MNDFASQIESEYVAAWDGFVAKVNSLQETVAKSISGNDYSSTLHSLLKSVQWVPYNKAHELAIPIDIDTQPNDIGSITGLFFELWASTIILAYLSNETSDLRIERNRHTNRPSTDLPRDPDLHIEANSRSVVVEIKVAPKKRDIDRAERIRTAYAEEGIPFFLIGGYVSVNSARLEALGSDRWCCFMSSSSTNEPVLASLPRLDDLLEDMQSFLKE